jgi:hypothetical protein
MNAANTGNVFIKAILDVKSKEDIFNLTFPLVFSRNEAEVTKVLLWSAFEAGRGVALQGVSKQIAK